MNCSCPYIPKKRAHKECLSIFPHNICWEVRRQPHQLVRQSHDSTIALTSPELNLGWHAFIAPDSLPGLGSRCKDSCSFEIAGHGRSSPTPSSQVGNRHSTAASTPWTALG